MFNCQYCYIIYLYLNIQTLKGHSWFDVVDDAGI